MAYRTRIYYVAIKLQGDQGFLYGNIESDNPYNAVMDYVKGGSKDSLVFITSEDPEYEPSEVKDYIFANGIICGRDIRISTKPMPEFEVLMKLEEALEKARKVVSNTFKDE